MIYERRRRPEWCELGVDDRGEWMGHVGERSNAMTQIGRIELRTVGIDT